MTAVFLAGVFLRPGWAQHGMDHSASFSVQTEGTGPMIQEYPLPTGNCLPYGIGMDSQGRIWYTAQLSNQVGVLDPKTGEVKEYKIPSAASLPKSDWKYDPVERSTPNPDDTYNIFSVGSPGELVVDSGDRVWFVQILGNSIGVFDPKTGEFTEYLIPTPNSHPYSLALDSQNNVWFIERNANKIGKLDFAIKKIVEYALPEGEHRLSSIAIDEKQNIWITDIMDNSLGLFLPAEGRIKRYPIYEKVAQPQSVTAGAQGHVWFAMAKAHMIAMLDLASDRISYAVIPGYNSVSQDLAVDDTGRVWYVDSMRNMIGYFDPDKVHFREWNIPTTNAQPMQMIIDRNGDIWFSESDRGANNLGRLIVSSIPPEEVKAAESSLKDAPRAGGEGAGTEENRGLKEWWPAGLLAVGFFIWIVIRLGRKGQ